MGEAAANVHYLPTEIERIGYLIRDGYERAKRGGQEQIEGTLIVAGSLYAARQHFSSDPEFGGWLKRSGYNYYGKTDRAALIAMGADLEVLRKLLIEQTSTSFRVIYQEHKTLFPQVGKQEKKQRKSKYVRTTNQRNPKRASKEMTFTIRKEKLGDTYAKIENTTLHGLVEMGALIELQAADRLLADNLVKRAAAGEAVSAVAAVAAKKKPGAITLERLIKEWNHCKMLRLWLCAAPETRAQFIQHMQKQEKVTNG